jgi:hypothetical protein
MPSSCVSNLSGEAARIFDDNAHAVALDPVEHGREPRPVSEIVFAANTGIVVLGHDLEPGDLGEARNRFPLPLIAVPICPDIRGRRGPQITIAGTFPRANFAILLRALSLFKCCATTYDFTLPPARPSSG